MKKDEFDTKINIEKFVEKLESDIYEIKKFVSFINADEKYRKNLYKGIERLEKKISKIKKCTTIEEASKYIKIKKLNRDFGEDREWFRE